MKSALVAISFFVASQCISSAVGVNLAQTAGSARFFSTVTASPLTATATIQMGYMSNEADPSTFVAFGTSAIHGNAVFLTGVGTLTDNTTSSSTTVAAGKSVYIMVYNGASLATATEAGIWKSSTLYPADFAPAGVTSGNASLSSDTWTVITPTQNWAFQPASYQADTAAIGLSDAQVTPTQRTGDKFTLGLGANIPEPSGLLLVGLVGMLGLRRKK